MQIKTLYRCTREDGGVTHSLTKPESEYTERFRIIAEEGKVITKDNETFFNVIDTESTEGWYEVDAPIVEGTQEEYDAMLEAQSEAETI